METLLTIGFWIAELSGRFAVYILGAFHSVIQEKIPIKDSDYTNSGVDMADMFREDGKIYVVIAVVLSILIGFIVYLVMTDLRLKKLEAEVKETLGKN